MPLRRLLLFASGLLVGAAVFAAEAPSSWEDTVAAARAAEANFEVSRALELYLEADRLRPDDPVTLQKIAQQLSDLTLEVATPAEKKAQAARALEFAQRAATLAPDDPVNVLSLAICYGKLGVYSDTRTKVEYSRLVRREAERALALDPRYDWAHHVLGRWHLEVAQLGVTARVVVRLVYGGLPAASKDEAIRHLREAVALAPERVPHHVELGFAYRAAGRAKEARESFERALALPSRELYDEPAQDRARAVLASARQGSR
jgi:tetratricopeptide (TPR) repeat protein